MINNTWNNNQVSVVDKLLFIAIGGGTGAVKGGEAVILAYEHPLGVIDVYSRLPFTVLEYKYGRFVEVAQGVNAWRFVSII